MEFSVFRQDLIRALGHMQSIVEKRAALPILVNVKIEAADDLILSAEDLYQKYAKANTRLLALTLASNLTGRIVFRDDIYGFFHDKGVTTFVDSSQGAGKIRLSMKEKRTVGLRRSLLKSFPCPDSPFPNGKAHSQCPI